VADGIIICAKIKDSEAGESTLFIIERNAERQEKTPLHTLSLEKLFAVHFENVKTPAENIVGASGKGELYLEKVLPKVTILKCGEMLGGLERVVEMTVEYVKQRHQFGRPLGSFQVIQHYCADMASNLESARLITYQAASLLSEGIPCAKEVAMANAWLNDAYRKATWTAQQVHGGMGFTEEYDLHLFYRHAKASELAFESAWFHRSKIAEAMGL
jgi:alkylation response protein AidB-like acyl-CoA dehydrogenase